LLRIFLQLFIKLIISKRFILVGRENSPAIYDAGHLYNKFDRRHKEIWSSGDIEMSKITERKPTQMLLIYGDVFPPLLFNLVFNAVSFVLPL
jgi:hypothetical protein